MGRKKEEEDPRPPDSDFIQHNLIAAQPILTPGVAIGVFLTFAVVFLCIGAAVLADSLSAGEVVVRYDQLTDNATSPVVMDIPVDMRAPIRFYYKITRMHQNHRLYGNSRSDAQLLGNLDVVDGQRGTNNCEPADVVGGKLLYPCGLMADSFFNDTFTNFQVTRADGFREPLNVEDDDLAFKLDKDIYVNVSVPNQFTRVGSSGFELPFVNQQDFIIWMKKAAFTTFKKLRFKILDTQLNKGDKVSLDVFNTFNVRQFGGTKSVVLMSSTWFGVKNDFMGFYYVVVGLLCLLAAIVFGVKATVSKRRLGTLG